MEDTKQFIAAIAVLMAKMLAIAIPPESKVLHTVSAALEVGKVYLRILKLGKPNPS